MNAYNKTSGQWSIQNKEEDVTFEGKKKEEEKSSLRAYIVENGD